MPGRERALLIAAVSGRALAASARRAGFVPLVVDFFADSDTERIAGHCRKLPRIGDGFQFDMLVAALEELAAEAAASIIGLVYGSGFEDRPDLLDSLARRWPVLGNEANAVRRTKDPAVFFPILKSHGVPHPQTSLEPPGDRANWLRKRRGGAGGSHVAIMGRASKRCGDYYQERVEGRAISALFAANGREARVLGFSEQWTAARRGAAWRYGGAVSSPSLPPEADAEMIRATVSAAMALELKGLGSADFILGDKGPMLLEINPRPGATLDIFDCASAPLLASHLDAVLKGTLPSAPLKSPVARASAIVYADGLTILPDRLTWPAWVHDRPKPGERIDKHRPICTVTAEARTAAEAKDLALKRGAAILALCAKDRRGDE